MNLTIMNMARAMLFTANLPPSYWSDAVLYAVYLICRTSRRTNENYKSPFEMIFKRKPDLTTVKIFGSDAYVQVDQRKDRFLSKVTEKGIFIGIDKGRPSRYIIHFPKRRTNQYFETKHATIDEYRIVDRMIKRDKLKEKDSEKQIDIFRGHKVSTHRDDSTTPSRTLRSQ